MKKVISAALFAASMAITPQLEAQRRAPAEMREARPPFAALLEHRQELGLTEEQVGQLGEIGRSLQEQNRPLRARLLALRQQYVAVRLEQVRRLTPEARRDTLRRLRTERKARTMPPELLPVVEEMRENTRRAMMEAQGVLSDAQKERARDLLRERRGMRRGTDASGTGRVPRERRRPRG